MKIELLPVSRWSEIEKVLRESRSDEQIPKPENSIILGAIEGEKLIGTIGAERHWVVSLLHVEKDSRGNGIAENLAQTLASYNTDRLREMMITTSPHVERLVFSMGFKPLRGQLWRRDP